MHSPPRGGEPIIDSKRICVIHWKPAEVESQVARLGKAGYEVHASAPDGSRGLRELAALSPDAFVIDLSRLPSHGRDVALALRQGKATRDVPLVFVEGSEEKVERIRQLLPDATYATWRRIRSAIRAAIRKPRTPIAAPPSNLAGYSGTPLPKKLGIKPNTVLTLIAAPPDFEDTLGELPAGVTIRRRAGKRCETAIWFVTEARQLLDRITRMGELADGLWIAWPKKASGVETDVTQTLVRQTGLDAGLVDYKICAIDATWSGLKFARRKSDA